MANEANRARYLTEAVRQDLGDRMVFLGGPRQVGKTTLALGLLDPPSPEHPAYHNWDDVRVHRRLLRGELPPEQGLIVLDEIHKYPRWRNLVKGFYDVGRHRHSFLVTGSARLDYYRRGGDSLQGRYHFYRLHPFSLPEMGGKGSAALLRFGGFPEPLLRGQERFWRRWQRERTRRIIHDDLRDLETVKEIGLLDLLASELPHRVGSPLSIRSLAEDLQVAHRTAERWVRIFERLYICFRISPLGGREIRAVKKEKKLYLWDWSQVHEAGPRFENMMAAHLLKYCHHIEDTEGFEMELRFVRDTDKREIDFVVLREGRPLFAVECKTGERDLSPAIPYFLERTDIPLCYQVHLGTKDYEKRGTRILPFERFCEVAGMV